MPVETEIALLSSRQDAQGRRLDTLENAQVDITAELARDLPALRTEVRLMTESFRSFRNALLGSAGVIVAGAVAIVLHIGGT